MSRSSDSSELRRWIGDQAISFFGLSESSIIDFIQVSASSSASPQQLHQTLAGLGLPDTDGGRHFATELFARVPRAGPSKVSARAQQQEQRAQERAQAEAPAAAKRDDGPKRYGLLMNDEDGREELAIKPERRKKKKRVPEDAEGDASASKRLRSGGEDGEEDGGEPEDEEERRERERLADQRERDDFAERMRQKDKGSAKKLVEDRNPEVAARRLLAEDREARESAMPNLRERSRQDYLAKRSVQQIDLLRMEIADEERFFRGRKLTKRELRDLEYKKEVLRLAEERAKIDDGDEGYSMPDEYITEQGKQDRKKKEALLYQRCEFELRSESSMEADSSPPQMMTRKRSGMRSRSTSPTWTSSRRSRCSARS